MEVVTFNFIAMCAPRSLPPVSQRLPGVMRLGCSQFHLPDLVRLSLCHQQLMLMTPQRIEFHETA
jgi:hypothetical protein